MKMFRQIQPEDSEVLRDGRWVNYDAPSLVRGDIIRMTAGDAVPADCAILSLGMDHVAIDPVEGEGIGEAEEMVVDVGSVTGEAKPRTLGSRDDGSAEPVRLYYGGRVLQGSGIAIVTAVGPMTALGLMIRDGRWPPKEDLSDEIDGMGNDDEARASLIDGAA